MADLADTTALGLHEGDAQAERSRTGFWVAAPAYFYLVVFFAIPFLIVIVYSFASRSATGATLLEDWNLNSYAKLFGTVVVQVVGRSVWIAFITTVICLLLAYPFAYYLATRDRRIRNVLLVLVMIPFWSNFLVRTYAWRFILSNEGPVGTAAAWFGFQLNVLFTTTAVIIGLVYGFLPFMILPLYAAIERLDWRLVEAARDLYADGWTAFRKVTLPLTKSGIIAGSLLVFVPSLGAYVTDTILGGAKTEVLGTFIVRQFQAARNWPFGSALSVVLMGVMLAAVLIRTRTGAREV